MSKDSGDLPVGPDPTDGASRPAWTRDDLAGNPHLVTDKPRRVQRMFSSIARAYDLNNRLHSFGRDQAWRRAAVRLAQVSPGDRVLDVACGTGDLALAFARAGAADVVGLDFTPAMLDLARRKAASMAKRFAARVPQFIQGDALAIPFGDASFDVVSIAFGIRNVEKVEAALAEFRRVLRPRAGRLVVLEFSQPRFTLLRVLNQLYTTRLMPLTASLIAGDRSGAYRYLPRSIATFPEGEAFMRLMRDAGFARISQRRMTFGVCTAYLGHVS